MSARALSHPSAIVVFAGVFAAATGSVGVRAACAQDVPQPPSQAVPQPPSSATSDPPARVGRLTALAGAVSYEPAGDSEWAAAEPNRPVTTGDRLWSDTEGRAEVQAGAASVRLWHETELDVTRLDDRMLQFRLPQGSIVLRVSTLSDGDNDEIDAPNAAVSLGSVGEYRVDVSADGLTTTVTVWSGSAEVTSAGSSFALAAHQSATIHGDSTPTYDVGEAGGMDDFEQWTQSRDETADRSQRRYVANDMPGVEDLDDSGDWDNDIDYGPVWYPTTVEVGWAPYHNGHWVWMGRWGWTWVDDAPWGWAPFHYGRWAYIHERWGWCPGRVIAPAVFAPGLVVFVGGSTWGAGVGWFPLAPDEVYRPAYPVSVTYIRRVNVTNVTNITNITNVTNITNITYRNRAVTNAVTVVPREAFVSATPVSRAAVRISEAELRSAPLAGANAPVLPTHASLVEVAGHEAMRPPGDLSRRVVVATHAPPPPPIPFALQERAIASNNGRPLASTQLATIRHEAPVASQPLIRTLPVRSAATPPAKGEALVPARPGLPVARPAIQTGTLSRAVTPPPTGARVTPAAPTRVPPSTDAHAVTTLPTISRPPVARSPERAGSPALNASYNAEQAQMEERHVQQFAKPPAGTTTEALSERQESEHTALDARYHQAAAEGRTSMPPPSTNRPAAHVISPPPPKTATHK